MFYNYFKDNDSFRGVYNAHEKLPKLLKNEFIVLNIDKINGPGTHWVLLYDREPNAFYFDSFGQQPTKNIQHWVDVYNKHLFYSSTINQDLKSEACGYFVTYVAEKLSEGHAFIDVLNSFDGPKKNEQMLLNYFNKKL